MNDTVSAIVRASRSVRYAATAALGMLALFLLIIAVQAAMDFGRTDKAITNTINVAGTGKSVNVPNLAQISFTVQESAPAVVDAQSAATKRTNDALAALKTLGIADKDVQATGYNIYPQYASQACPPGALCPQFIGGTSNKITGYQVSQTVSVKVRDTAKVGDVLQKLGTLGVQNVSGPSFTVDDNGAAHDAARGLAIADAQQKAALLAKQLGVRLGKVISFSENGGAMPVYSAFAKGGAGDASAVPSVPAGQNETDVNVTITYEIR